MAINITLFDDSKVLKAIQALGDRLVNKIDSLGAIIMSAADDFRAKFAEFDVALADVATDIETLVNRVPAGPLTAEEVEELKAGLTTRVDALKAVASKFSSETQDPS